MHTPYLSLLLHVRRCSQHRFRNCDYGHLSRLGYVLTPVHHFLFPSIIASLVDLLKERLNVVTIIYPVEEVELVSVNGAQQSPDFRCTRIGSQLSVFCPAACILGVKFIIGNWSFEVLRGWYGVPARF